MQSATQPNDGSSIAASGDCGVGFATRNNGKFSFMIDHKAAYLRIYPYLAEEMPDGLKLLKITLKATDEAGNAVDIVGVYDFKSDGLSATASTDGSKTITFTCGSSGFEMGKVAADALEKNGCYVVMHPTANDDKLKLSVSYMLKNTSTGAEFEVTREMTERQFLANSLTNIRHKINKSDADFSFSFPGSYFMWSAKEWFWWNVDDYPTVSGESNPNYPKSATEDPDRWYPEYIETDASYLANNNAASNSAKDMPCYNAMMWYLSAGAYWDANTEWSLGGTKYKGGIWLKKWDKIPGKPAGATIANCPVLPPSPNNILNDGGVAGDYIKSPALVQGKPSAAEIEDYFYLPASGLYNHVNGALNNVGSYGYYWLSTPYPENPSGFIGAAYRMYFSRSYVRVSGYYNVSASTTALYYAYGYVAGTRSDGSLWFQ